ncbi:hypothetical protein BJV82DRAFT_625817 [Fennellomyces sp. T-0311]|nr:hypothetical protein BJV82DRAFT_625817 [Fennellomyces sp. T-0311]
MRIIESSFFLLALGVSCHAGIIRSKDGIPTNRIYPRQDKRQIIGLYDICPLSEYSETSENRKTFNHFSIFTRTDFVSSGTRFSGPILAGNSVHLTATSDVTIGQDDPAQCSNDYDITSYGLVAGSNIIHSGDTIVYGSVNYGRENGLEGGGAYMLYDPACSLSLRSTGSSLAFDISSNLGASSSYFSTMTPTYRFDASGAVSSTGFSSSSPYTVFLLDTCNYGSSYAESTQCAGLVSPYLSNPSGMLFGDPAWNGIDTTLLSPTTTIVINIPVRSGMQIWTNYPSLGLANCRTIFNFYPADDHGIFTNTKSNEIIYSGDGTFEGFIIAYRGIVRSISSGTFAGKLFAEQLETGNFDDFSKCDNYDGCFPVLEMYTENPEESSTSESESESTSSVSETESSSSEESSTSESESESTSSASETESSSSEESSTTSCDQETTTETDSKTTTTTVGTLTSTGVSTATITHKTTLDSTAIVTVTNPGTTTLATTTTDTYTSVDSTQITTTTTYTTSQPTVLVPVQNELPSENDKEWDY